MIVDVIIIRKGDNKFLSVNDDGNWAWVTNLDDATVYKTDDLAKSVILEKKLVHPDVYTYQIPYSTLSRKHKKSTSNIKRSKSKCRCK